MIEFSVGVLIGAGGVLALGVVLLMLAIAAWMASGSH